MYLPLATATIPYLTYTIDQIADIRPGIVAFSSPARMLFWRRIFRIIAIIINQTNFF